MDADWIAEASSPTWDASEAIGPVVVVGWGDQDDGMGRNRCSSGMAQTWQRRGAGCLGSLVSELLAGELHNTKV